MEESTIIEQVKKWLGAIEILNPGSCIKTDSMTTASSGDSGISVSSSADNPYEKLVDELKGYLDVDDEAIKEMFEEVGKGTSSTVTSANICPEIYTYPTRDDYLKEKYNPFIKPVDGKVTIDDREHDTVEVKVVDVGKVDAGKSDYRFGDWIMRSDPGITITTKDAPSVHFNDAAREGARFVKAANTAPAPKPVPVKDTEFTRLWNKLDDILL